MAFALRESAQGTPDGSGNVTLTFKSVTVDEVWTGVLTVKNAPAGALWTVSVDNTFWGQFSGTGPFGPVQAFQGQQIILTATGAGSATLIAALIGSVDNPQSVAFIGPSSSILASSSSQPVVITGQPLEIEYVGGSTQAFPVSIASGAIPDPLPVSGTVTADQGTSPWVVSGTVTADQGSPPWSVQLSPQKSYYGTVSGKQALTASSTASFLILQGGGTGKHTSYLTGLSVTFDPDTAQPAVLAQLYQISTGTPVGTAAASTPYNLTSAASDAAPIYAITVEPTTVDILEEWELQPFGGGVLRTWDITKGECPTVNPTDLGIGLRIITPAGITANVAVSMSYAQ